MYVRLSRKDYGVVRVVNGTKDWKSTRKYKGRMWLLLCCWMAKMVGIYDDGKERKEVVSTLKYGGTPVKRSANEEGRSQTTMAEVLVTIT